MDSDRDVRSLGVDGAAALQLLNVEKRAAAASCAAVAFVIAQEFLGARFVEVERVIVEEFFASADVTQRVNEYAIPFPDGFAVRVAGMVDPARFVSADGAVDDLAVVDAEKECVRVIVLGHVGPGHAFADVPDDAGAFANGPRGKDTAAVDARSRALPTSTERCELEVRRMGARATALFEEPFLDVTSEYSDLGVNLVACEERCFEKTVIKRKQ